MSANIDYLAYAMIITFAAAQYYRSSIVKWLRYPKLQLAFRYFLVCIDLVVLGWSYSLVFAKGCNGGHDSMVAKVEAYASDLEFFYGSVD